MENNQLICYANQLTGFYRRAILALNGLRQGHLFFSSNFTFTFCVTLYYLTPFIPMFQSSYLSFSEGIT